MTLDQLTRDLETKRTEGAALLEKTMRLAQADDRLWTDEERAAIQAIADDGHAIQAKIAKAKGDLELAQMIEGLTDRFRLPATAASKTSRRLSLGQQFVHAPEYEFFRQKRHRSASTWRSESFELFEPDRQATTLTEDPASGGNLIIPQYLPGILPLPTRPLIIADLFAQGTTTSNSIVYMREKTFTNAAAPTLEGAAKPESALVFESVADAVRKIAHWLPVSEEMLEDVAQISSYIDARLRLGVQLSEDDQLLNGDGIAPHLLGLLARPGLAAPIAKGATESNADAMLRQYMTIYATSFLVPDGFVFNPMDWAGTLLQKSAQGQYYTPGPFQPIQSQTLWGLPVGITPAMLAGTGLVGAFQTAAQVFRHGGIRVEASNSHQDFFIKNLVAIRAEERAALAVYRPQAFGTVTGLLAATGT